MPGKKGNTNALKHGIYSKFVRVIDDEEMAKMKMDKNHDELAYARTRLAAAQKELNDATDPKDKLGWDYACRHWTEIIASMTTTNQKTGEQEVQIFESIFEAVRSANDKQNWKR
jgi:hypothetical protein